MKLSRKLFWSLFGTALGASALLLLLLRWGLADSFAAYLRAGDEARLDALVPTFIQLYDEQTGWDGLRPPPGAEGLPPPEQDGPPPEAEWQPARAQSLQNVAFDTSNDNRPGNGDMMGPPPGWGPPDGGGRLPPPRRQQPPQQEQQAQAPAVATASSAPPSADAIANNLPQLPAAAAPQATNQAPPQGRNSQDFSDQQRPPARALLRRLAPDLPSMGERFSVYDADGKLVLGHHAFGSNVITRELVKEGHRIGYLGLASLQTAPPGTEAAFIQQESRNVLVALALVLLLSGGVGWWLAGNLSGGIAALLRGNAELRKGNFSVRLPDLPQDEIGKLAEDFNTLAASLERTEKARQQWAADIAHELRTPLTVMRAELESIQDGVYQMDARRVDLLHKDVLQLTRLVEDLNVLAMADMGALHYHLTPVKADALVGQLAESMRARLAEKGLELNISLNAPNLHIKADVQKIGQLVTNLLENAGRYTDAPGQVQVSSRSGARMYELTVEDSPPGVPDWALPRLFDRLFRLDKSRSRAHGGSGLGLAICQTIVEAHGGRIFAQHSSLGGLLIRIELPYNTATRPQENGKA